MTRVITNLSEIQMSKRLFLCGSIEVNNPIDWRADLIEMIKLENIDLSVFYHDKLLWDFNWHITPNIPTEISGDRFAISSIKKFYNSYYLFTS